MTNRAIAFAVLMVTLAACSGPSSSIEVGSKDVSVDIIMGEQTRPVPPIAPGASPIAGFPGFIAPPVPRLEPGAPPPPADPPQACPIANPLDAAKLVAMKAAPLPPVQARYTYRNEGTITAEGVTTAYPPEQVREVRNVRATSQDSFEFDVAATLQGVVTTTTYRVLKDGPTLDRGVYIAAIVTRFPSGDTEAFNPDQPLLLLPFPPPEFGTNLEDEIDRQRGQGYRSTGTDPLSQTTMVVEARVVGKERANACGEWVDAWDVEVTQGRIVGPTKNIEFTGHYLVATQYGGLVVKDNLRFTGTEDLEPVQTRNRATINRVPREPR